ncbi:alpha-1,6-glucosidase domain-containing protein [Undibacterium sp. Rencai35W]|uniref:alpha-1,6-glucosidase domain-containing protein n=1 Tax=Undibacterium sp. Rencai35W TaxID=3413046 RepID=UPI003BF00041
MQQIGVDSLGNKSENQLENQGMIASVISGISSVTVNKMWRSLIVVALVISILQSNQAAAADRFPQINAGVEACNEPQFQTVLHTAKIPAEARAVWLDARLIQWPSKTGTGQFKLYYSATAQVVAQMGERVRDADGVLNLSVFGTAAPAPVATRFSYLAEGVMLQLAEPDVIRVPELLRRQLVLVQESADGVVLASTHLQVAGVIDDVFDAATMASDLGVTVAARATKFRLWAPTAQQVYVCSFDTGSGKAVAVEPMLRDPASGIWSLIKLHNLSGKYYQYLLDVVVNGAGVIRNRVTDPYSVSLTTDSKRSYIASLDDVRLKPDGWDAVTTPAPLKSQTDMVVYELHVRDFSINDPTVSAPHRGKYAAFTEVNSNGMRHLQALATSGLTDIHLLPIFDFATVPEKDCLTPVIHGTTSDTTQQAVIVANAAKDCFNWGYDPYHYNAPEGSYATDSANGATRITELRQMVMALHRAGLRVGMDVVYNHTAAAGQKEKSVLDRIVPGYYQRLNASGAVEQSTCCDNTATENKMMAKLMVDSVLLWAKHYKIDSFRFDLMAHQPRQLMEQLKAKLTSVVGHDVQLIGEGWNFGEVENGARFVQASQLSLNGSGIGTFSDRARDAVRGGGAAESGDNLVKKQGYINGLFYAPNELASQPSNRADVQQLMDVADMVRVGLAGSLRDYLLMTRRDVQLPLAQLDYSGQPAGYVSEPSEVVNYVENHDNQTLFDANAYKLPTTTSHEDRTRVQMLGAAINAFSQGVAYFHAGIDTLRSKSMDKNSFDSGDWFNRIDWSYQDNYFGTGLPPSADNAAEYAVLIPLLSNAAIKPCPGDIAMARDMFRDLLKIRASSSLFRLKTSADIRQRLHFYNTGSQQNPVVLVAHLDGRSYPDAGFKSLMYFINVAPASQSINIAAEAAKNYVLHPVHGQPGAADQRPAQLASYDAVTGLFTVPARSAVVFVER